MLKPDEVKKVWDGFQGIKENACDAIQLLSMTLDLTEQSKQSLKNKANAIRQGLAELDNALEKL